MVCSVVKSYELGSGRLPGTQKGSWLSKDNIPACAAAYQAKLVTNRLRRIAEMEAEIAIQKAKAATELSNIELLNRETHA